MTQAIDQAKPWDRPLIGPQLFKHQVWCCGRSDEASLLRQVVGWAVDSQNARDHARELQDLIARGLITTRTHRTPFNDEWEAYALTAAGFDRLAEIGARDDHDAAVQAHRFYAERGSL